MPHFKCVACKTRLYSAAGPYDQVGDLCPGCGSLLEPVGELAEIVGFRAIKRRDGAVDDSPPGTHERIAGRVDDFFARRKAICYRCRCDHVFQVLGQGRHRRFYELDDQAWRRPVMAWACPSCQHRLPTTRGHLSLETRP